MAAARGLVDGREIERIGVFGVVAAVFALPPCPAAGSAAELAFIPLHQNFENLIFQEGWSPAQLAAARRGRPGSRRLAGNHIMLVRWLFCLEPESFRFCPPLWVTCTVVWYLYHKFLKWESW